MRLFNDYLTDKHFEDIDKHLPKLELITINGLNDNTINCLAKMPLLSIIVIKQRNNCDLWAQVLITDSSVINLLNNCHNIRSIH